MAMGHEDMGRSGPSLHRIAIESGVARKERVDQDGLAVEHQFEGRMSVPDDLHLKVSSAGRIDLFTF
jgi:uncharacterized protein YdeI (YjbR/CyaY-like superfamily)